ncbi:solute carrier family 43 member 3-like [Chanos chanos]|uniref:Solute carrier family 43 member 3-like n=1 Tax=Chanos chanos TaxID=29144 RepID=A0A6J2WJ22_CHACN|nr:solute carrier family 43 member 3-like [Chanos chanos]
MTQQHLFQAAVRMSLLLRAAKSPRRRQKKLQAFAGQRKPILWRESGVGMGLRYRLTLVTGLLECLCFAGVVFGWASLVFVLKTDGYFSDLCANVTGPNSSQITDCIGQDEQFSLVFTVASFLNNFLSLPNGFIFDHFGTMATRFLAIFLYTTGTLLMGLSNAALSILLFPALSLIAVGGILFLMTNIQVGNLFGAHRSTIITLYNGAFDSSSAVFLIIKVLHEGSVSLHHSFIFLSVCSVLHILRTVFLMPKSHIPYPIPDNYTYGVSCAQSDSYNVEKYEATREKKQTFEGEHQRETDDMPLKSRDKPDQEDTGGNELSFKSCVLSWFFLWHLVWLSVLQLRHYLFIGTLNSMLNRLTNQNPALVSQYTNAFAFTQLCGILCAPWNGLLMDRNKGKPLAAGATEREEDLRSSVLSLFLTSLQCLLFSVCAASPVLPLQYLTFILQVLNRSFLYGGNAAFISIAFPACHFGKLYGLVMSLSAVVSLLQYPCFTLVKDVLGGDPFFVNIGLTLLTLLAFIHPLFVYLHCRRLANNRQKMQEVTCSDPPTREVSL